MVYFKWSQDSSPKEVTIASETRPALAVSVPRTFEQQLVVPRGAVLEIGIGVQEALRDELPAGILFFIPGVLSDGIAVALVAMGFVMSYLTPKIWRRKADKP